MSLNNSEQYLGISNGIIDDLIMSRSYVICSICRNFILENEQERALECGHDFHDMCLKKWLVKKQTCPNCRNVLNLDEIDPDFLESQYQVPVSRGFQERFPYRKIIFGIILFLCLLVCPGIHITVGIITIMYYNTFGFVIVYTFAILLFVGSSALLGYKISSFYTFLGEKFADCGLIPHSI
jgi:hypothetical protein